MQQELHLDGLIRGQQNGMCMMLSHASTSGVAIQCKERTFWLTASFISTRGVSDAL